ncbi:IS5/IS1182 family transposase, partial [Klebsiella pneumoniae]
TRNEIFLSPTDHILPRQNMVEDLELFYPTSGTVRRPYPL